ncbi:Gtr2 protein [Saccharomycopsis crataegensis]|uniref:GTP-binding protein n=1 Tax=Saccharomycopsis crataegensis TaxID=43959 RepID=A0AAV5QPM6_9ASCO|nr:Gtr2 protein [Saccharomycopsis crataegensis]
MSYSDEDESLQYNSSGSNHNNDAATVILMGRRRSGKSSILEAVFHKMKPWESVYIESTAKPEVLNVASLININLMELPGQIDYVDPEYDNSQMFRQTGAIIYVIDAQDEYYGAVRNLIRVVEKAYMENPNIRVEVLVHKIDGLSEEFRDDTVRDIKDRTSEMLYDGGLESFAGIDFYQTSIYDQSIYEVLSKIISRLIPELPSLEHLLDNFVQHSAIEKAFICDLKSKLYFVTDSSPLDSKIYEVCAELIDLSIDLDSLLGGNHDDDSSSLEGSITEGAITDGESTPKQKRLRCVSKLSSGIKLYLHEVLKDLCLIAFIRDDGIGADDSATLAVLDYNAAIFRKGLERIFHDRL